MAEICEDAQREGLLLGNKDYNHAVQQLCSLQTHLT